MSQFWKDNGEPKKKESKEVLTFKEELVRMLGDRDVQKLIIAIQKQYERDKEVEIDYYDSVMKE